MAVKKLRLSFLSTVGKKGGVSLFIIKFVQVVNSKPWKGE